MLHCNRGRAAVLLRQSKPRLRPCPTSPLSVPRSQSRAVAPHVGEASTSTLPVYARCRSFSSSRSSSFVFFGLSRKDKTPEAFAASFLEALTTRDVPALSVAYGALRNELHTNPSLDPADFLSHDQLSEALSLLSVTAYIHADFNTFENIFWDISELWEEPAPMWRAEDHTAYLRALTQSGQIFEARSWLESMKEGLPRGRKEAKRKRPVLTSQEPRITSVPRQHDFYLYLDALRQYKGQLRKGQQTMQGGYAGVREYMQQQEDQQQDSQRTDDSIRVLAIRAAFEEAGLDPDRLRREIHLLFDEIKADGSEEKRVEALTTIVGGFVRADMPEEVAAFRDLLVEQGERSRHVWNAFLQAAWFSQEEANVKSILRDMQAAGTQADQSTFLILLEAGRTSPGQTLSDLREQLARMEQLTGVLASHGAYSWAISRTTSFTDAWELYRDSQRDGVVMSSGIMTALVSGAQSRYQLGHLREAYKNLLSSPLADERNKDGVHEPSLYIKLLRFCASHDVGELQWATQLLEDMRLNGLGLPTWRLSRDMVTARMVVQDLMRHSTRNHSEAFRAYSWTLALDPKHIFTTEDFYEIIRTFADLSFTSHSSSSLDLEPVPVPKRDWCPLSVFLAFFEDMNKAGLAPTSKIYQAILHYYASENYKSSGEAVRQLHDLIKMDYHIDPDIGLMNRLMFAYSRTQNTPAALGVWRNILLNRLPYNNVSISIVLDAYGFQNSVQQADSLWQGLKRQEFALNKKNLESYIEALGRNQRIKEATTVLFEEASQFGGNIEIDAHTLEVLLKFARPNRALFTGIQARIQSQLPEMWASVENVASSAPSREREVLSLGNADREVLP